MSRCCTLKCFLERRAPTLLALAAFFLFLPGVWTVPSRIFALFAMLNLVFWLFASHVFFTGWLPETRFAESLRQSGVWHDMERYYFSWLGWAILLIAAIFIFPFLPEAARLSGPVQAGCLAGAGMAAYRVSVLSRNIFQACRRWQLYEELDE